MGMAVAAETKNLETGDATVVFWNLFQVVKIYL